MYIFCYIKFVSFGIKKYQQITTIIKKILLCFNRSNSLNRNKNVLNSSYFQNKYFYKINIFKIK